MLQRMLISGGSIIHDRPNACSTMVRVSEVVLSTAQKGELAILRAQQRAFEKGWIVSRPTRDCRYDLVLDDGERLYRVQVKYAARKSSHATGAVSLDFTKGGRRNRMYQDHEIDA